jgi:hypothetical protein
MLPIFRTVTVGGVLLAILLLALALSPPGRTQTQFSGLDAPARGVMIDAAAHPEWRQFIILAAFQRATELSRLRELPDTPTRLPEIPFVAPDYVPPQFPPQHPPAGSQSKTSSTARYAGLPTAHDDTRSDDDTGSLKATPEATMPIDIGEPSSTELPVTPSESAPPVLTVPVTEAPPADNPPVATTPVGHAGGHHDTGNCTGRCRCCGDHHAIDAVKTKRNCGAAKAIRCVGRLAQEDPAASSGQSTAAIDGHATAGGRGADQSGGEFFRSLG